MECEHYQSIKKICVEKSATIVGLFQELMTARKRIRALENRGDILEKQLIEARKLLQTKMVFGSN